PAAVGDRRLRRNLAVAVGRSGRGEVDRLGGPRDAPAGGGGPGCHRFEPSVWRLLRPHGPASLRPLINVEDVAGLCVKLLLAAAGQPGPGREAGGIAPDRPGEQLLDLTPTRRRHPTSSELAGEP